MPEQGSVAGHVRLPISAARSEPAAGGVCGHELEEPKVGESLGVQAGGGTETGSRRGGGFAFVFDAAGGMPVAGS